MGWFDMKYIDICWFTIAILIVIILGLIVTTIPAQEWSNTSSYWCMYRAEEPSLVPGWNLIGICSNNISTASELSTTINNCTIISMFNSTTQSYQSYFVGGPSSFDFPITCEMGLFILIEE